MKKLIIVVYLLAIFALMGNEKDYPRLYSNESECVVQDIIALSI